VPLRHSFLTVLFLVLNLREEAFDNIRLPNLLGLHLIEYMRFRGFLLLGLVHCDVRKDWQATALAEQLFKRRLQSLLVCLQSPFLDLHLRHCECGIRLKLLTVVGSPAPLSLGVQKLAPQTIGAVEMLVVLLA
jgi:hypothetical protein